MEYRIETKLAKAQEFIDKLGFDNFYTINVRSYEIVYQANYDSQIVRRLMMEGYVPTISRNGFTEFTIHIDGLNHELVFS